MLTIIADLDACQGYACCLMEAPSYFSLNDELGKVIVLRDTADDADRAAVESAVRSCPAKALRIERS